MKRVISVVLCILTVMLCFGGCGKDSNAKNDNGTPNGSAADQNLLSGMHHVRIAIKDYGTLTVELNADKAPITVTNFINLAKSGFYDNLTFHRIVSDFVIQGGDPDGNGTGGSGKQIKGEFKSNGVDNDLKHTRGAISMARASDPDSATSQFFICHKDCPNLDGDYAVFGYVTKGMDVVDSICEKVPSSNLVPKAQQPVIETIKVID